LRDRAGVDGRFTKSSHAENIMDILITAGPDSRWMTGLADLQRQVGTSDAHGQFLGTQLRFPVTQLEYGQMEIILDTGS
jgi:hypothetical protein